jgi:hypothetical protein
VASVTRAAVATAVATAAVDEGAMVRGAAAAGTLGLVVALGVEVAGLVDGARVNGGNSSRLERVDGTVCVGGRENLTFSSRGVFLETGVMKEMGASTGFAALRLGKRADVAGGGDTVAACTWYRETCETENKKKKIEAQRKGAYTYGLCGRAAQSGQKLQTGANLVDRGSRCSRCCEDCRNIDGAGEGAAAEVDWAADTGTVDKSLGR